MEKTGVEEVLTNVLGKCVVCARYVEHIGYIGEDIHVHLAERLSDTELRVKGVYGVGVRGKIGKDKGYFVNEVGPQEWSRLDSFIPEDRVGEDIE